MDAITTEELRRVFGIVLAPLLFLTSCATLVWGLQNRYSRLVHAIRDLYARRAAAEDDRHRATTIRQAHILETRARALRNGVVGYYLAMACFLSTAILLAVDLLYSLGLAWLIVLAESTGLVLVGASLVILIADARRSFEAISEEVNNT